MHRNKCPKNDDRPRIKVQYFEAMMEVKKKCPPSPRALFWPFFLVATNTYPLGGKEMKKKKREKGGKHTQRPRILLPG